MNDAMMAETISIAGHGGDQIEAYLARPLGDGPYGGVVVIHHMPGYDEGSKEITRTFAVPGDADGFRHHRVVHPRLLPFLFVLCESSCQ